MSTTGDDLTGNLHLIATIKYQPGTLPKVLPWVKRIEDHAKLDPNCVRYELLIYPPTDDLVVIETYTNKAAFQAHADAEPHVTYMKECEKYIVTRDWKFYTLYEG